MTLGDVSVLVHPRIEQVIGETAFTFNIAEGEKRAVRTWLAPHTQLLYAPLVPEVGGEESNVKGRVRTGRGVLRRSSASCSSPWDGGFERAIRVGACSRTTIEDLDNLDNT